MRKGRPGHVLSVLTDGDRVDLLCRVVFEQTTTFGVRVFAVERRALHRDRVAVPVGAGTVHVKRAFLDERVVTTQPEYDEALAEARRAGTPVAAVLAEANRRLGEADADAGADGRKATP
jgi:uncharacterized protein (DUF111 family)